VLGYARASGAGVVAAKHEGARRWGGVMAAPAMVILQDEGPD
jgi:hypothetical protein